MVVVVVVVVNLPLILKNQEREFYLGLFCVVSGLSVLFDDVFI